MEINTDTIGTISAVFGAVCSGVGFVFGLITKRERRLTRIETKLDRAIEDIDGIARVVGTKRALGEMAKESEEEENDEEN